MAAVAPVPLETLAKNKNIIMEGSDVDAEGEEDVEMEYTHNVTSAGTNDTQSKAQKLQADEEDGTDSDEDDAEGADDDQSDDSDAEGENEDDEAVGAVKVPPGGMDLDSDAEDGEESEESDDEEKDQGEDESESSEDSDAVEQWEDASAGEGEADISARNNCVFCKLDEEHDPSEEFEDYLSCSVCGDNAHRQCARNGNSLLSDDQANEWCCPQCVTNSLAPGDKDEEEDEEEDETSASLVRRLSTSSSRLTRDLLPAPRGGSKAGSYSMFSNLIHEDDPGDGSRSLRKRKSSSEARDLQSTTSSKRLKRNSGGTVSTTSGASSVSDVKEAKQERDAEIADVVAARESRSANKSANQEVWGRNRPKRQKQEAPRVRPLIREAHRMVIAIRVDLSKIKEKPPKKSRRPTVSSTGHARFAVSNMQYGHPFYSLHTQEADESKIKPYGGILTEEEADTAKTFPAHPDRARFEEARQRAEEDWKVKTAAAEAETETKRASQKVSGPASKIKCINFGGFEIDTWYAAPYPEEYSRNRVLYICEFCLKYMPSDYVAWRHKLKCPAKHPPGDEIYRDKSVSIFEVDGRKNPVYCQNLCLLAKLFLGSKTLYYDVDPFLFYIMTEYDDLGYHFVGYFSKEKRPSSMNNVSCILTLPIHQRKGYGNLLIDFSYLLTRVEQKTGSPEKPLSDMGLVSYRNYWRLVLSYLFLEHVEPISVSQISDLTGMTADDIIAALEALRALVRDPVTKTYGLRLDRSFLKETIEKWETKGYVKLNPDALVWTPYVLGHYNLTNYDRGAISTVAPREDEDEIAIVPEEGVQQQQALASTEGNPEILINGNADTIALSTIVNDSKLDTTHRPGSTTETFDPSSPVITNGFHTSSISFSAPTKPSSPIPPSRYEIYPPIPGTVSRRRPAKSGARRSAYTPGSAPRRDRSRNGNGIPRVNGISPRHITTPTTRKTRSALGKEAEASAKEEAKTEAKGKPTVVFDDEKENDKDLKKDAQDEDEDAEGESDLDAEGEEDPGADVDAEGDDDDEEDEGPGPEAETLADLSEGEDDDDFEPNEDGDADGDEEEEEGDEEDEDPEGEAMDDDDDVGPDADAEGESDPGDDMVVDS